ncbi:hypothetical protein CWR43_27985 [Rhizobium sullae]|uniref:Uncharacterized protein n=1 Tax=Rhizobium sullae TaxID=50338 RepID=A0A2N0D2U6_RHISU|nr:hypothetical protein [Rhizobium sullae]PKA40424.1 hypothetical protein CWR43_27985 [Rhizobium sullae]
MKIISKDNFASENVADSLVAENVHEYYAKEIAEFLQKKHGGDNASRYYEAVGDDYVLWRGMEEFV